MKSALRTIWRGPAARRGFTLTELLVVIGVIALLMSIGFVGLRGALGSAKRAFGTAQLQSIAQGLEAFKGDLGGYPPLITQLNDDDEIMTPEVLSAEAPYSDRGKVLRDSYRDARYMSEWTIGVFLLGAGDINGDKDETSNFEDIDEDGDTDLEDNIYDDGAPGFGIRDPGRLGAWKKPATTGSPPAQLHLPPSKGRAYGPYLEPGSSEGFIERVEVIYDDTKKRIVETTPGKTDQFMYRIVDSYGNPVRYYRNWINRDDTGDATVLRAPIELRSFDSVERQYEEEPTGFKAYHDLDKPILNSPYMLLAAGAEPDGQVNAIVGEETPLFGDVIHTPLETPPSVRLDLDADPDSDFELNALETEEIRLLLRMLKTNLRYSP